MPIAQKERSADSGLAELFDKVHNQLQAGEPVDWAALERQHAEHVEQLRALLPVLELMGQLGRKNLDPATSQRQVLHGNFVAGVLGDYRIGHEIGRGGMGVVYEAEQISLGRTVALKVLPFAAVMDQRAITRFKNEARAAATLDHPHIVPIHAVGNERGVYYYAMSLVNGMTLAEVIGELQDRVAGGDASSLSIDSILSDRSATATEAAGSDDEACSSNVTMEHHGRRSDSRTQKATRAASQETQRDLQAAIATHRSLFAPQFFRYAAQLGLQAAEGLEHAHQHGIVHRDVKPGNLMIDLGGKLWITDFGLARMENDPGVTMTGDVIGTLRYMAPEQALAKRVVVDHRADIYSLGVTLYELLTLRPVYNGRDREELMRHIAFEEPTPLRHVNRAVPRDLETIVLKAIAKNPNERYASAHELADDLRAFIDDESIKARPPTLAQRGTKWATRHMPLVAGTTLFMVFACASLLVGNLLITRQRDEARHHEKRADENFRRAQAAVEKYLTKVSENELLNAPSLQTLRKDLLELALQYYQEFINDRSRDPELQAELAAAHYRVGNITEMISSSKLAIESHRAALRVRERLVADAPDVPSHQHDLAISYRRLGSLEHRVGHDDEALVLIRRAIETSKRLAAGHPQVAEYQDTVAASHLILGQILMAREEWTESRAALEESIAIRKAVVALVPNDNQAHHALGGAYFQFGNLLRLRMETMSESLDAYQQALKIRKKLVEQDPRALNDQRDLAGLYNNLGLVYNRLGETDDAVLSYKQAIAIMTTLVAENPLVRQYQHSLAGSHHNLALHLPLAEAIASYEKAIRISTKLVRENPDVVAYRDFLAKHYGALANLQYKNGRFEDAENSLCLGISIWQELVEQNPSILSYKRRLAAQLGMQGLLLKAQGRLSTALDAFEEALSIEAKIVANDPSALSKHVLSGTYCNIGSVQRGFGNYASALALLEQAMTIQSTVVEQSPDLSLFRTRLGIICQGLGLLRKDTGQLDSARSAFQECIDIQKKILEENPNSIEDRRILAKSHTFLGYLQHHNHAFDQAMTSFNCAIEIWEELLAQNASDSSSLAEFAYMLAKNPFDELRDAPRAVELATRAAELAPDTVNNWSILGTAHFRAGQFDAAIEYLTKYAESQGDNDSPFLLAMAYQQVGDPHRAREYFNEAVLCMNVRNNQNPELKRLQAEAAELLDIGEGKPVSDDDSEEGPPIRGGDSEPIEVAFATAVIHTDAR